MEIGISIIVTFLLVLVIGYFSISEAALGNAKKALLQKEADEGNKRAKLASTLTNNPHKLSVTIQVAITLCGFFAAVVAAINLASPLAVWLTSFNIGWLSASALIIAPVLITLCISFLGVVLGYLLPQRIALVQSEKVAKMVARPVSLFSLILSPLASFATLCTNGLAKLFRVKTVEDNQPISEEEIKHLVTDAAELLDDEKRMIHEIIDLGDTMVREVMTPRVDMILVEDVETVQQAIDRMRGTGYSRLPVYHEDYDRIIGIAYFKDLVTPLMEGKEDEPVEKYAFEAFYVPETKEIYPLLSEMQTNRQQMAIVVDEYGGTDGLITVEDIIEEIVGEIIDESDPDDKYLTPLSDDEWLVDGRYPCDDSVELGWPVEESGEYETIAGWLMDTLDSVPKVGEELEIKGYSFKIQSMRRHRISIIRVKRLQAEEVPDVEENETEREEDAS
ncbi:MAG: hemolysin family protein [Raoultibacter sp.]|jgi:putative hemolysin